MSLVYRKGDPVIIVSGTRKGCIGEISKIADDKHTGEFIYEVRDIYGESWGWHNDRMIIALNCPHCKKGVKVRFVRYPPEIHQLFHTNDDIPVCMHCNETLLPRDETPKEALTSVSLGCSLPLIRHAILSLIAAAIVSVTIAGINLAVVLFFALGASIVGYMIFETIRGRIMDRSSSLSLNQKPKDK